ncbi:hypothetical protein DL96DRAFT_1708656 [Flagelloscypha sp. PMI_526]|nr:hypothetical protein DL96DRAFT_1708656 [Flagelloscypha sp. PMI_526]
MTNPRQRRKNRSASYKAVSHSRFAKTKLKKTPPIRGPKVLQDNWDPKKTVKQNYAALGLALGLTPYASGGIEKDKELIPSSVASTSQQTLDELPTTPASLPAGYGRIIRD